MISVSGYTLFTKALEPIPKILNIYYNFHNKKIYSNIDLSLKQEKKHANSVYEHPFLYRDYLHKTKKKDSDSKFDCSFQQGAIPSWNSSWR